MKKKALSILLLVCFLGATGCAAVIVGAGAGAGVFTYLNGELIRTYQSAFDPTYNACESTFKRLKISIAEVNRSGIETTIKAKQIDGVPVTAKLVMIASNITEVSIRTGIIGVWDRKVSELIHAEIKQRLDR